MSRHTLSNLLTPFVAAVLALAFLPWIAVQPSATAQVPEASLWAYVNDGGSLQGYSWPTADPDDLIVDVTRNEGQPQSGDVQPDGSWSVHDYPLVAGDEIVATNGSGTAGRSLIVTDVEITSLDVAADFVSGVGVPGSELNVSVHAPGSPEYPTRSVVVGPDRGDGLGDWSEDFAVPGDQPGEEQTLDILACGDVTAEDLEPDGDLTRWVWWVACPRLTVQLDHDSISGHGWVPGTTVAVDIDTGPPNYDFVDHLNPVTVDGSGNFAIDGYDPAGVDRIPGYRVTADDGTTVKTLIIADLRDTAGDADNDLVTGFATPVSNVSVIIHNSPYSRGATTDGLGAWTADFSPGDADDYDLQRGDAGLVFDNSDDDGDITALNWNIPLQPWFTVETPHQVWGHGEEWPLGATVDLEVDTDGDGTPDYTDTTTVESWGPDPWNQGFNFNLDDVPDGETPFEIQPGYTVTITASDDTPAVLYTKDLEVAAVSIDDVDVETGVVSGQAPGDAWVNVNANTQDEGAWRDVQADGTGFWVADFATPVGPDEQGDGTLNVPLGPGTNISAQVNDHDGDTTHRSWQVPQLPWFTVETPHQVWGHGEEWPLGATVDLEVDTDGDGTPDYTDTTTVESWGPDPWNQGFNFSLDDVPDGETPFEIQPGYTVTITASDDTPAVLYTKDLEVAAVSIDDVDVETGVVSGQAPGDAWVNVNANTQDEGAWRDVQADGTGFWVADFATPVGPDEQGDGTLNVPLGPGTNISAQVNDHDGDTTHRSWQVPQLRNHHFVVAVNVDSIEGHDWPDGATVDFAIDDPETPENPDYQDSADVGDVPAGSHGNVGIQFGEFFDVLPGHVVTVTDGESVEVHTVQTVVVTDVDAENDLVTGTADPGDEIWVQVNAGEEAHLVVACDDLAVPCGGADPGTWVADFSSYDLQPGMSGGALEVDPDNGNETEYIWWASEMRIHSSNGNGSWVHGEGFGQAGPVLVSVFDDAGCPGVAEVEGDEFHVEAQELCDDGVFDPGQTLQVHTIGGELLRELTLHTVFITAVDVEADAVSGLGDEGVPVRVSISGDEGEGELAWRVAMPASGTGAWTVSFTTPPDEFLGESGRQEIDGHEGAAFQWEDDGDHTESDWFTEYTTFIAANAVEDRFWLQDWPSATPLALSVFDSPAMDVEVFSTSIPAPSPYYLTSTSYHLDGVDLLTGQHVVVEAGGVTREVTLAPLSIVTIDFPADTIVGTASPNAALVLSVGNDGEEAEFEVGADGLGGWTADFGGLVDFSDAIQGFVGLWDDDRDLTFFEFAAQYVEAEVDPGGSLGSGDGDGTVDEGDPFEGELTLPDGGRASLTEGPATGSPPGWVLVGNQLVAEADVTGTPENPLIIVFRLYGPTVGVEDVNALTVLKGDVPVPECDVPPAYAHETEACVSARWQEGDEMEITVFTLSLSTWSLALAAVELGELVGPVEPVETGSLVTVEAAVHNRTGGPLTAIVEWGDGAFSEHDDQFVDGSFDAHHVYGAPGVYAVTMTVLDATGGESEVEFNFVVVYDAAGKKMLGSGEFEYEQGDDEEEFEFGFNIKRKNDGILKGDFEFEYEMETDDDEVKIEFEATTFDLMLIFSDWAFAGGTGELDDGTAVDWFIHAVEGKLSTPKGDDLVRMKVTLAGDPSTVVYDTEPGLAPFDTPSLVVDDGKIKIKKVA